MVTIKLYKHCKLNNSYNQVFYPKVNEFGKGKIDDYLLSLESKSITLEYSYLPTPNGTILLDYTSFKTEGKYDIFAYNYIEIKNFVGEDEIDIPTDNIRRFAFINNITVINEQLKIDYEIDYWHSYAHSMKIQNSLLVRTNDLGLPSLTEKIGYYHLPTEYITTKSPKIKMQGITDSTNYFFVVCKMQFYKPVKEGEISYRHCKLVILSRTDSGKFWYYSLSEIEKLLQTILYSSQGNNFTYTDTLESSTYNYELTDIYLLPASMFNGIHILLASKIGDITLDEKEIIVSELGTYKLSSDSVIKKISGYYNLRTASNYNIDGSNFKIKTIGTLNTQIAVDICGSDKTISFYYQLSDYGFHIYMGVNGQLFDVTEDFRLDIPISIETANVTQLKAISRSVNSTLNITNSINGAMNGVNNIIMGLGNIGQSVAKPDTAISGITTGYSQIQGGITSTAQSIIDGVYKDQLINAAVHTSNSSIKANDNAFAVAYAGVCVYEIEPDNEKEVEEAIKQLGYSCARIVNDIFEDIPTENYNYNNIKFATLNITGNFSQSVMRKLESILLNGVRVFYTNEITNL